MKVHIWYITALMSSAFVIGCIIALFYTNKVIWVGTITRLHDTQKMPGASKKEVLLLLWHTNVWKQEKVTLWWHGITEHFLHTALNAWVAYATEEHVLPRPITIQSVILSPNGQELYVSFDQPLCGKELSTHATWMLIESLLKTIQGLELGIQRVRFLVDHTPWNNPYLDFEKSWPITGFAAQ